MSRTMPRTTIEAAIVGGGTRFPAEPAFFTPRATLWRAVGRSSRYMLNRYGVSAASDRAIAAYSIPIVSLNRMVHSDWPRGIGSGS